MTTTERLEIVKDGLTTVAAILAYVIFYPAQEDVRFAFAAAIMLFSTLFLIDVAFYAHRMLRRTRRQVR